MGFEVKNVHQTLEEIAKENRTSPEKLYEVIKSVGVNPSVPSQGIQKGTGLGRKTLDTICSEKALSIDDAVARLKEKGIEAKAYDRIKDIADRCQKAPSEILAILEE